MLLWCSVTIWINLLEFIKVLLLKMMQLCKPTCAARTLRCCFERCELVRTTARALWHEVIRTDVHCSFAETNACYAHYAHPITLVSKRNFVQIVCLRIVVLFIMVSIWFSTVKWSRQKVLTGGNISRGRVALHYWRYEVHWFISKLQIYGS